MNEKGTGDRAGRTLRVLLVEDSADDAELLRSELCRIGYAPDLRRVETREEMQTALHEPGWDVIISDHSMPVFSSTRAFALLRETGVDLPFIIVSGSAGEDMAVEAMRTGVNDYLLKGDLRRLKPALERELRESARRAEMRKTQQQLVISERMASVGTLAAGVAHEINNPLSVVVGNLDCAMDDLGDVRSLLAPLSEEARNAASGPLDELVERLRGPLTDAQEAAERVRLIVRDLRLFSRADEEARGPVDVRKVLDSSLRMAWNEIRHRAQVVRDYGEVRPVLGNDARLGQVFLNLLVNAAQAIPEGNYDDNTITVTARPDRGRTVVEVSDTGGGIAPDVLPHIFDIFFTTKPIGVGTGLGLSICHRIVTQMGGEIAVDSTPGKGTTFRIALPAARTGRTREMAAVSDQPIVPARRAAVLIVEDEQAVGRTLQRQLAQAHDATVVRSGKEALERLRAGATFDVILTDLMMPEMTGIDLYRTIAAELPAQASKVIFLTGGVFTPRAREFLDKTDRPRLDKPVDVARLRRLVAEMVAEPP